MNQATLFNWLTQPPLNKTIWVLFIAVLYTVATLPLAHSAAANSSNSTESATKAATDTATKSHTPIIFTANYKANIKGFAVNASRELKVLDNAQFALSFNATSWAAKVEESSIFSWKDGEIQPVSYRYLQTAFGKKREQNLLFNSTEDTINSDNNGDKRVITQTTRTLDKLNYQLQLQQDLLASHSGVEYTIADKGNLKSYRFEMLNEETIDTHSGSLSTIKVKVIRANQEKTTYIWFAKDWNNLLVKLEQYNGDKQTLAINLDTATVNNIPVKGN